MKTVHAATKDAVFQASIEFIGALTGMTPPPIEIAPAETFKPFADFTNLVCEIFEKQIIVELTKERDAYEKCADTMAAAHKVERDALKDAARLALDELERLLVCSDACTCSGREAIAALKAVL